MFQFYSYNTNYNLSKYVFKGISLINLKIYKFKYAHLRYIFDTYLKKIFLNYLWSFKECVWAKSLYNTQ